MLALPSSGRDVVPNCWVNKLALRPKFNMRLVRCCSRCHLRETRILRYAGAAGAAHITPYVASDSIEPRRLRIQVPRPPPSPSQGGNLACQ